MPKIHSKNHNYDRDLENLKFWFEKSYRSDHAWIVEQIERLPEEIHFRATEEYNKAFLKLGADSANAKLETFVKLTLDAIDRKRREKSAAVSSQLDAAGRTPKKGARVKLKAIR